MNNEEFEKEFNRQWRYQFMPGYILGVMVSFLLKPKVLGLLIIGFTIGYFVFS